MDRMSATDAGFYFAETENAPLHVGSVAVFDGPPPSYGDLVRLLLSKLPMVPRYRQRVRCTSAKWAPCRCSLARVRWRSPAASSGASSP